MSTHPERLVALIPTRPTSLYDRFGLDIIRPAQWDDAGVCTGDMEPLVWLELGTRFGDLDDGETRDVLDDLANDHGYVIDWSSLHAGTLSEFDEVDIYTQGDAHA